MASITDVRDALRARLEEPGSGISIPLRWDVNAPLPDTPADFGHVVLDNLGSRPGPTAFGGGRGSNLYRSQVDVTVFVFVPIHAGIRYAEIQAETIAAWLRSYRDDVMIVRSADPKAAGDGAAIAPPGLQRNELNNYLCAYVEADVSFDQIG